MLQIKPADADTVTAVRAFNARLEAGGSSWQFYDYVTPTWLAPTEGATVWREHYVLRDDVDGLVRGGYVLKHETFLLDGEPVIMGHQQGPVAESVISPQLRGLGFKMVADSLERLPLQIGWGATIRQGWEADSRPALLYVVNKGAFLRRTAALRKNPKLALALDISTSFGIAQIGLAAVQTRLPWPRAVASEEPQFGTWADEVWEAAKGSYRLLAVRDAKTLNRVMPAGEWPNAIPLKVTLGGRVVGWAAVRDHQMVGDPQFGDLRSGSIVDALAVPGMERAVIAAATRFLASQGVDFVGAVFSHANWIGACQNTGFIALKGRRGVGFSPELVKVGGGFGPLLEGTHFTLMDADGPRLF